MSEDGQAADSGEHSGSASSAAWKRGNGPGVAALVLGIVALALSFIPVVDFVAIAVAVAGLVVGIVGLALRGRPKTAALTGTILSGVALVVSIVLVVVYGIVFADAVGHHIDKDISSSSPGGVTASSTVAKLGSTVTFADGLKMSVTTPKPYQPGAGSAGAGNPVNLEFTVAVENDSTARFESALVDISASSGGHAASPITDLGNHIGIPPTAVVKPGAALRWNVAESFPTQDPIRLEIKLGPRYAKVAFTS